MSDAFDYLVFGIPVTDNDDLHTDLWTIDYGSGSAASIRAAEKHNAEALVNRQRITQRRNDIVISVHTPDSSNIRHFGWHSEMGYGGYDIGYATVEFNTGLCYRYTGVDLPTMAEWVNADSAGKFFTQNIKAMYQYERIG